MLEIYRKIKGPSKPLSRGFISAVSRAFQFFVDMIGTAWVILKSARLLLNVGKRRLFQRLFKRQLYSTGVRAVYINVVVGTLVGVLMISKLYDYFARRSASKSIWILVCVDCDPRAWTSNFRTDFDRSIWNRGNL
jgi:ABC-type transporter Mla maintaining outer membrane lipid asymmetry permease subunit MlaE